MAAWQALNQARWYWRCPIKIIIFGIVTVVVLYPKLWLLPTTLHRYSNMNAVLDPRNPELAALEEQVSAQIEEQTNPHDALKVVQQVVYQRIPYAWDWEVWGVCEYLPTVDEVFAQGREDCDGRAVVAASLLRRLGYKAWLVSDMLHVWVETEQGETMSPTGGEKTLVGTDTGTITKISPSLLKNLVRGFSYGVAVFPLTRELIILLTFCLLSIQPGSCPWRRLAGCLVLWIAMDTIRGVGIQVAREGGTTQVLLAWSGGVLFLVGWLILALRVGDRRPRSLAKPLE